MSKYFKIARHPKDYSFQWSFCVTPRTRFYGDDGNNGTQEWKGFFWGYWGFYFRVSSK